MDRIVILFLTVVFIDGLIKRQSLFELFIEGVKEALSLIKPLFTTLMAFMLFVQLLRSSGTIELIASCMQPLIQKIGVPVDVFILGFLRPVSANASLSFLYTIYEVFGVDHPLSLLSTLIQSGSDTTLYVVTLYFSSLHMKNTRYAIALGLFMDMMSIFLAIMIYLKVFV